MTVDTSDLVKVEDQIRSTQENVVSMRLEIAAMRSQLTWISRVETVLVALATAILGLTGAGRAFDSQAVRLQSVAPTVVETSTSTSATTR